jgi:HK97 family phage prohead protease
MQVKLTKNQDFFQITTKSVNEIVENDKVVGVEIEGYASTKDKDRGKDIVEPTAFKNALDLYMTNPVVLLQHDTDKPIGLVTQATIDSKGLYVKAKITEDTDGVFSKLKNKVLRAFSIGYRIKDYEINEVKDDQGDVTGWEQIIKDLELFEISLVSIPMNPYALTKSMANCFEEVKEETVEPEQPVENTDEEITTDPNEVDTSLIEDDTLQEINEITESEETTEENEESVENEETVESEETKENEEETPAEPEAENVEPEAEPNEAVDNTEISEETTDPSENVAETATSEGEIDQAEKAVNVDLQKKAEFDYEAKMLEQDKKIADLTQKLDNATDLIKGCVEVLNQLNETVENTAVKTGFIYERPAEKAKKGY